MTDFSTTTASASFGNNALQMTIDDVFHITGRGVVAVGTIQSGTVSVGDDVDVKRDGVTVARPMVTGVEMFRKLVDEAKAGDHVGLLLSGVTQDDLSRGMRIVSRRASSTDFGSATGSPVTVDGKPVTTTFGSTPGAEAAAPFSTFDAPAVDRLSDAAANAADHKDFTKGVEFRGLGFTDDSTPGHVGSGGKSNKTLVFVLVVILVSAAIAARMFGIF